MVVMLMMNMLTIMSMMMILMMILDDDRSLAGQGVGSLPRLVYQLGDLKPGSWQVRRWLLYGLGGLEPGGAEIPEVGREGPREF